jgi:deoxyribodipyrimidine photolyase-related protein
MRGMLRRLIVVLGDQLDEASPAFSEFDPKIDCIWMAEVREESTHVVSSKARIVMFLAAMRHFRDGLLAKGWRVEYTELQAPDNAGSLACALERFIEKHRPKEIVAVEPGEWRLREGLRLILWPNGEGDWLEDTLFLCSHSQFEAHAKGRKQLRMEFFYREMRQRLGVLMEGCKPAGGEWNFDALNRGGFGKNGPERLPAPIAFAPDSTTRSVIEMVDRELPEAPGTSRHFDFPVTRQQALEALSDFITNRLPYFGQYQDAMWTGQPWLYHARLSAALNLKLIGPLEVITAAEKSWNLGLVPIAAAEGFIRQILGWREYVRGIYWRSMPGYLEANALEAHAALPAFYWTGETDMQCLKQAIGQTLKLGYAHHIQRLMVTGLYALLLGVRPNEVHEWYLGVYIDAVEWVEIPNTIGMSQYADGGVMASKPYAASGKYIQRMSDYCRGCIYDPALSVGEKACPFTTLYWDFLARNRARLGGNQRMALQLKNLDRFTPEFLEAVRVQAALIKGS